MKNVIFSVPDVWFDLTIVYVYFRYVGDCVDTVPDKLTKISIFREYQDQLFANRVVTGFFEWQDIRDCSIKIDWNYFTKRLSENEIKVLKCMAEIIFYMPQEPFEEFINGLESDLSFSGFADDCELQKWVRGAPAHTEFILAYVPCFRSACGPSELKMSLETMFNQIGIHKLVRSQLCKYTLTPNNVILFSSGHAIHDCS